MRGSGTSLQVGRYPPRIGVRNLDCRHPFTHLLWIAARDPVAIGNGCEEHFLQADGYLYGTLPLCPGSSGAGEWFYFHLTEP